MKTKNPVLKKAQKLGRNQQKSIVGGVGPINPRYCCEYDELENCIIWTCNNCYCP